MTLSSLLPCEQIYPLAPPTLLSLHNRRRIKSEEKAKVVTAVWETDLIQFLAALDVFHKDDFKDRMNKIKATWRNGCFEKKYDHPVHNLPNHHQTKMGVLQNTFVQIIFAAIWLVQHSSTVCPPNNSADLWRLFCPSLTHIPYPLAGGQPRVCEGRTEWYRASLHYATYTRTTKLPNPQSTLHILTPHPSPHHSPPIFCVAIMCQLLQYTTLSTSKF